YIATSRLELERAEEWTRHARALLDRLGERRAVEARQLEAEYASRLGTLHVFAGRLEEADRAFREALELAGPDDDTFRAGGYNNLGDLLVRRGELTAADAVLRRSADLYRELVGSRHPSVAIALNNLGELALRQGRWAEARALDEEARAILQAAFGPEHPHVGVLENNLGQALLRLGDHRAAAGHFERAQAIFRAAFGDDAAPLAYPLTGLGEARLAAGEIGEARTLLERALVLREGSGAADLGGTRFALARALVDQEPVRAHGLATSAAADFAEAGPAYARERGEVEVWLAEHPLVEGGEVGEAGEGGAASGAEKGPSDVAAP
ncbi:MAG: tetratricopeptide repeat protein, partial [Myxococcales bacterium]|nr:tetratricopeptide repeat protein [Myxococcales bacterium]